MHRIDFEFIHELEGGSVLLGYVPDPKNSQSGVTIAAGFDLGARNDKDLRKLELNATLIGKLYPYLGRKGNDALAYLAEFPLILSEHEAAAIDTNVKVQMTKRLIKRFNADSIAPFHKIPDSWQTVIASVEFQYGNLSARCPTFWKWATLHKWDEAILELRNFGDSYPSRRNREADYVTGNS